MARKNKGSTTAELPINESETPETPVEGAATATMEPEAVVIVKKEFQSTHESGKNHLSIDVRAINSNTEQSRGNGVLDQLLAMGWKAFPGDLYMSGASQKEIKAAAKELPSSVVEELTSDDPTRQAAMLNLIAEHEPDIWTMVKSLEQHGQLMAIRVRPNYDEAGSALLDSYDVIAGARRTLARCIQYAMMSCGMALVAAKDEKGKPITDDMGDAVQRLSFWPLTDKDTPYTGLNATNGLPLIEADVVEGLNQEDELKKALEENRRRKNQSPIDDAKFFRRMKTEFAKTVPEIAEMFYGDEAKVKNKSQMVTQRLTLLRLTPEEQARVHRGDLGVVKAIEAVKAREANSDDEDKKNPTDKPKAGERVKMPSVAQARELFYALSEKELTEDVRKRFGKPKIFALTRDEKVRQFIAECCGEKYITLEEVVAKNAKEEVAKLHEQKKAAEAKKAAAEAKK